MDSREKVAGLHERLLGLTPEDEKSAQRLQLLAAISPLVLKAIPEDPAELDGYLRTIAWGAAQCRSDEAPTLGVFEWDGERWQPVEVEE